MYKIDIVTGRCICSLIPEIFGGFQRILVPLAQLQVTNSFTCFNYFHFFKQSSCLFFNLNYFIYISVIVPLSPPNSSSHSPSPLPQRGCSPTTSLSRSWGLKALRIKHSEARPGSPLIHMC